MQMRNVASEPRLKTPSPKHFLPPLRLRSRPIHLPIEISPGDRQRDQCGSPEHPQHNAAVAKHFAGVQPQNERFAHVRFIIFNRAGVGIHDQLAGRIGEDVKCDGGVIAFELHFQRVENCAGMFGQNRGAGAFDLCRDIRSRRVERIR